MKIFIKVIIRGTLEDDLIVRWMHGTLRYENGDEFRLHNAKLSQFH